MALKLKIILIFIIFLFLIYICKSIKSNKLSTRHAFIWFFSDIIIIFSIIFVESLLKVSNFIGIETVSNMMFFLGFVFLIVLCFNISIQLSNQNKKIIKLTQELGILKNKLEKDSKND